MFRVTAAFTCLALASCGTAPAGRARSVDAGTEVTLAPGETATVKSADVRVRFVAVSADSRCPRDVTCIWAGEVKVQLEFLGAQLKSPMEVVSGSSTLAGGWRVTLVRVEPAPTSTSKIAPADYRATLMDKER